ncbi:uncharacterized protein CLUP02_01381 [Colletotrichum lupini]|uniref:Uncharacterized protein n=1 Tax=Colletotrichum lupini TaxID=145971 RepID=A0A9Q8SCJ9_9PEZI|nr:uncharacterized protein CLUP02_01381 [Colletotrichum lupini]UQC74729.1 hypothetical protein CLUP02_01381 [Colletotrichum lupini]
MVVACVSCGVLWWCMGFASPPGIEEINPIKMDVVDVSTHASASLPSCSKNGCDAKKPRQVLRRQSPSLDAGVGRHGFIYLTAPTRALRLEKRNCHHKFFECRWERRSDLHTFSLALFRSCRITVPCVPLDFPRIDLSLSRAYPLLRDPSIGKRESTARAFWTSLLHRPRAAPTLPRFPTLFHHPQNLTEQIIIVQLTPHDVKNATPPTHLQSIPSRRITRKSPQSVTEPDFVIFWFETSAGGLPYVTISSTNVLTVFVIICRRHLWLSSCGVVQQQQQQQISNRIIQEIPECYQEPLSIVYLHHVSSDSRVFQPHYAQLWLNTLLRTPYHMVIDHFFSPSTYSRPVSMACGLTPSSTTTSSPSPVYRCSLTIACAQTYASSSRSRHEENADETWLTCLACLCLLTGPPLLVLMSAACGVPGFLPVPPADSNRTSSTGRDSPLADSPTCKCLSCKPVYSDHTGIHLSSKEVKNPQRKPSQWGNKSMRGTTAGAKLVPLMVQFLDFASHGNCSGYHIKRPERTADNDRKAQSTAYPSDSVRNGKCRMPSGPGLVTERAWCAQLPYYQVEQHELVQSGTQTHTPTRTRTRIHHHHFVYTMIPVFIVSGLLWPESLGRTLALLAHTINTC